MLCCFLKGLVAIDINSFKNLNSLARFLSSCKYFFKCNWVSSFITLGHEFDSKTFNRISFLFVTKHFKIIRACLLFPSVPGTTLVSVCRAEQDRLRWFPPYRNRTSRAACCLKAALLFRLAARQRTGGKAHLAVLSVILGCRQGVLRSG